MMGLANEWQLDDTVQDNRTNITTELAHSTVLNYIPNIQGFGTPFCMTNEESPFQLVFLDAIGEIVRVEFFAKNP